MKSVINEAKYTRRFNTGDYEFEEFSLGAVVDERESGKQVLRELKLQVKEAYSGSSAEPAKDESEEEEETKPKKKEKKNGKSTKRSDASDESEDESSESEENEESDGEGSDDDEAAESQDNDDDNGEPEEGDSEPDEDDEPEEDEKPKSKKGKGKKSYKVKDEAYNRAIEQHKEIFSKLLGSVSPDWKKSDKTKLLAKEVSKKLNGQPFLNGDGEVLDSFKSSLTKAMKAKK